MESTGEMQIQVLDKVDTRPEHKPKVYDESYHQTNIRVLEFDHHDSEQAGVKYELPENWKEVLQTQIEQTQGPIAPEYCLPDLEKYLFNGPVGPFVKAILGGDTKDVLLPPDSGEKKDGADSQIVPFYGFVTKTAGSMQRNLIATDTANKAVYRLFADVSMVKHQSAENQRRFSGVGDEFKYEYGNIDPSEYKRHDSNDGRHLVTARGLMQEALRSKASQITAIWAPKHAERIADYIERQIKCESEAGAQINSPVEFKDISPPDEKNKMIFYGRPPLMRSVREYQPTLSSTAYKVDLLANEKEINKDLLRTTMAEYLSTLPKNKQEKRYQSKIRRALRKLDKTDNVRGIVNTDKVGWKQTRNDYIY